MSEIGKRINKVISLCLAPYLKQVGFNRKGRTFRRVHDDRVDVVNIQGGKWNSGNTGEIAVNLGVYYPEIAKLYDPYLPDGLPEEYHCTIRVRLGMLETGTDKWWKIGRSTDEQKLSEEVLRSVQDFGIPWIEKMASLDAVADDVPKFISAVIAFYSGAPERAKILLAESYEEAPGAAENSRQWAIEHGLGET